MNKLENLMDLVKANELKINELLGKKKEAEKKKPNVLLIILAVIGAVAAVAGIVYLVYRHMAPDYLEDFEDDFEDDDFEDEFEDEESSGESF